MLKILGDLKLNVDDIRGQGYDNGANMRGKHAGVQARMPDLNKAALFVNCSSHSLNLVVGDSAKCCVYALTFFSIVQRTYKFFALQPYDGAFFFSISGV